MDLKTKVIVAEVSNLTDARYFAAWGAKYFTYIIEEGNPDFLGYDGVKEIMNWVEGPKHLGHLKSVGGTTITGDILNGLELSGLVLDPFVETEKDLYDVTAKIFKTIIWEGTYEGEEEMIIIKMNQDHISREQILKLKEICQRNMVYIDGDFSVTEIATILQEIKPEGIVLKGGEEEKVGFKSYDELDEIFEYLEIEN